MRVIVTGGEGKLGRQVRMDLLEQGHEVVSVDQTVPRPGDRVPGIHHRLVMMDDLGAVVGAARGADAMVHLAAIPSPYSHPDEFVFINNVRSTFHGLQAASVVGIKRVVIASSASAYGMAWARPTFPPTYVPVDEDHPFTVLDPYALSKETDERTAQMFAQRDGMTIVALRFHWIAAPGEVRRRRETRGSFTYEDATNLWGYVDIRDASHAVALSLEAPIEGFRAFNISAADTTHDRPTEELLREVLPATEVREPHSGFASPWSIRRATEELGYAPSHSWRDN